MPKVRKLVVTYRKFDHLTEVEWYNKKVLEKLERLTVGTYGCMYPVLKLHKNAYVNQSEAYDHDISKYVDTFEFHDEAYSENRSIAIAFHKGKPIAWTMNDLDNMFNVYVHRSYRHMGIAMKLAELWVERNVKMLRSHFDGVGDVLERMCHNEDAEALMREALEKYSVFNHRKVKKSRNVHITHKVIK